jgi:hypothetical protein
MHRKHPLYSTDVGIFYHNMAQTYLQMGESDQALESYRKCLKAKPHDDRCNNWVQNLERNASPKQQQKKQTASKTGACAFAHSFLIFSFTLSFHSHFTPLLYEFVFHSHPPVFSAPFFSTPLRSLLLSSTVLQQCLFSHAAPLSSAFCKARTSMHTPPPPHLMLLRTADTITDRLKRIKRAFIFVGSCSDGRSVRLLPA